MKLKHLFYLLLALPLLATACNDDPEEPKLDPVVTVTEGVASLDKLTFSVEPKNADSAAWVVFESSEAEPTADDIIKNGTPVNAKQLTEVEATNLKADTEYSIVAAAAGNGKVVKSAVVKMTTLAPDAPTPEEPTLTLKSDATVEFGYKGGEGDIAYELTNPVEGVELEAKANANWITNLSVEDVVVFKVAANDSEDAREGKITVSYDKLSFDVTVKQAGKPKEENKPIEKFDVTFTSASYLQTSAYGDAEVYQFRNEDGFQANIYFELSNGTPLVPGVYTYSDLVAAGEQNYSASDSRITIIDENGEKLTGLFINSGTISVAIENNEYKVDFDLNIKYNSSTPFKASFRGLFANDTVWEEGQEPNPVPEFNNWNAATLISNASGAIEIKFTDSSKAAEMYISFYTNSSYLPAATYKPGMPSEGYFAPSSYLLLDGEKYYYNLEGMNTTNNGVVVELADDNTYTFTFNDMTFGTDKLVKGGWSGQIDGLKKDEPGSDFTPDYVAKEWMWQGYSGVSWGNCYNVSGDNFSLQIHFCQDVAQETSIVTGDYIWSSTTGISNSYPERFALRSVYFNGASVAIKGGTLSVSASGDEYTINMTLNSDSETYKVQFVGKLNEAYTGGGEGGGTDEVITLTTLTYVGYNTTYWFETFNLSDGGNNSIDLCFNEYQANASKIYGGEYEWITISQVGYDYGYFATNNIIVNGASKKANGGLLNITENGGNNYTFDLTLEFNDGTSQKYKFSGALN